MNLREFVYLPRILHLLAGIALILGGIFIEKLGLSILLYVIAGLNIFYYIFYDIAKGN